MLKIRKSHQVASKNLYHKSVYGLLSVSVTTVELRFKQKVQSCSLIKLVEAPLMTIPNRSTQNEKTTTSGSRDSTSDYSQIEASKWNASYLHGRSLSQDMNGVEQIV